MGLTVSLKTTKHLVVRRKNETILTVSRKKVNCKKFVATICPFESVKIACLDSWLMRLRRLHILPWYRNNSYNN